MLVVSGNESFSIYLFADGSMQWTTSDADGGSRGIGGEAAQVGYVTINVKKYLFPGSRTCSVIEVPLRSNVNVPGMFVLALNGSHPVFGKDVHILENNTGTMMSVFPVADDSSPVESVATANEYKL